VRVNVRIGGSKWSTSVFPGKTLGGYILPIKKAVPTAEGLSVGDEAEINLELLM